jgi:hypothetical protein
MMLDRTPPGATLEFIEDWLRRVGSVQETDTGFVVQLTPDMLRDYAEWVAAVQREAIAQTLERMPDGTWAKHCAQAIRNMRAEH